MVIQYDTAWYSMIQYDTVFCSMIQYDTVWYSMIQYDTVWFYVILCDFMWYYVILCDIMWYYVILCDIMWYYVIYGYIWRFSKMGLPVPILIIHFFGWIFPWKKTFQWKKNQPASSLLPPGRFNLSLFELRARCPQDSKISIFMGRMMIHFDKHPINNDFCETILINTHW